MTISSKAPTVSIGIPTYNRADGYLWDAVMSALCQTYENVEVIVSDNCSSDSTEKLMTGIDDPRLNYLRHETNIGPNGNFNACLNAASGDYFLLLCDDDIIDEDLVDVCMRGVNYSKGIGVIRTGTRVIDEHGGTIYERQNQVEDNSLAGLANAWFGKRTAIYLCSTLFNTAGLRDTGGLSSKHNLLEDGYGIARLGPTMGMHNIVDVKASFRRYPAQRTNSVPIREWCEDYLGLLQLFCEGCTDEEKPQLSLAGRKYFCGLCLTRIRALKSPVARELGRVKVYQHFGYRVFFERSKGRVTRVLRRALRR